MHEWKKEDLDIDTRFAGVIKKQHISYINAIHAQIVFTIFLPTINYKVSSLQHSIFLIADD